MENLQRFIQIEDISGIETIWTCCVICLGNLAALCHLISQTVPTLRGSMDDLCDLTLEKLASLSHEVHIGEYSHFDILTGVCDLLVLLRMDKALIKNATQISWKRALDMIDIRIGSRSHVEGTSLRYWRGIIGKAYADLQVNLLRCGPSLLISLALLVDGRTEGSRYPNLLLQNERENYGF